MNRILILLAVSFIQFTANSQVKFTDENNVFSIKFPIGESVSEEKSELTAAPTYKYLTSAESEIYYIAYTFHEYSLEDNKDELLDASVESFVSNIGGTILESEDWERSGLNGKKVTITIDKGEMQLVYLVVITGRYQYQLVGGGLASEFDEKMINKFIKSFKLLN